MVLLGTKICLVTLAHWLRYSKMLSHRPSELTCTATLGRCWDEFLTIKGKSAVHCFGTHNAASKDSCKELVNSAWSACNGCMLEIAIIPLPGQPCKSLNTQWCQGSIVEIEFNLVEKVRYQQMWQSLTELNQLKLYTLVSMSMNSNFYCGRVGPSTKLSWKSEIPILKGSHVEPNLLGGPKWHIVWWRNRSAMKSYPITKWTIDVCHVEGTKIYIAKFI
jgi:hypothetical protein